MIQSSPNAISSKASGVAFSSAHTTAEALLLTTWTRKTSVSSSSRRTESPNPGEGVITRISAVIFTECIMQNRQVQGDYGTIFTPKTAEKTAILTKFVY